MMRRPRLLLALSSVALVTALSASPVLAATYSEKGTFFAGYAAASSSASTYIGAKATFTVPAVGSGCTGPVYLGAFVGIPPFATTSSSTRPSIGAVVIVGPKGPQAFAGVSGGTRWGAPMSITIRTGDRVQVRVSVSRSTSKATFYFENFTTTQKYAYTKSITLSSQYNGRDALIGVFREGANLNANIGTTSFAGANVQLGADGSWKTVGSRSYVVRATMVNGSGATLTATGALNTTTLNSFSTVFKACK